MDKKSIIGFILMGIVLFGFTAIQSKKTREAYERQQAQRDSIALVEAARAEAMAASNGAASPQSAQAAEEQVREQRHRMYKDSLLDKARNAEERILVLENDVFEVAFNTRGAQPYSVRLKNYYNYDSTDLYVFRPAENEYAISVYVGEYINTKDFVFDVAQCTDTTVSMRLHLTGGGYIEQRYAIEPGSYMVRNSVNFVGVDIPRNVGSIDMDIKTVIPRMEKGYKNEVQYSKANIYFSGEKKPEEFGKGRSASKKIDSSLSWFAFQQQFFSAIVCAPQEFASGKVTVDFAKEGDPDRRLMTCSAQMRLDIKPSQDFSVPIDFYYGPNHFNTLKSYDRKYEKIIPLGGWLVGWFTKFFIIPMFNFLHRFIDNFGIIILIMTIIIKLVVFPFTYKSYASSAKMSALKPLMDELNRKYPRQEDALKKQQATMDLYKRADCSPMGGCLPTLLTFPILWAMFRFFPASIELRQQHFLWAEDLSAYDSVVNFGTRIPLLGDHLSLFALLMAVVMWLYSKITMNQQPAANDPSAASMKFMSVWLMPIMMFFICNNLSSGLSYYYLLSQLIAMIQIWIIRKSIDPAKVLAKVEASKGKPLPKSKWQQRLEEAQKMQEQQLKARRR